MTSTEQEAKPSRWRNSFTWATVVTISLMPAALSWGMGASLRLALTIWAPVVMLWTVFLLAANYQHPNPKAAMLLCSGGVLASVVVAIIIRAS